ncbi:MAG TPA: pentapeptide repeat-containing protein [Blastocatellia bacterium]|nr:pentapeptide repeat-containing protein [Blastocatellia bacterium]
MPLEQYPSYFVCAGCPTGRSACGQIYKDHNENKFCVLHYPASDKLEDFKSEMRIRLRAKDFDFRGVWFPDGFDFAGHEFPRNVDFIGAIFNGPIEFNATNFAGTDFTKAIFKKAVDFSNTKFNGEVSFDGAKFEEATLFHEAYFSEKASFRGVSFMGTANFDRVHFHDEVYFDKATFTDSVSFQNTNFEKIVHFGYLTFNKAAYFGESVFTEDAIFFETQFNGVADFLGARFDKAGYFSKAVFKARTIFFTVNFEKDGAFSLTHFREDVDFRKASFKGNALFTQAYFHGDAIFRESSFSGKADFGESNFSKNVDFHKVRFDGDTDFINAKFPLIVDFSFATFASYLRFAGTKDKGTFEKQSYLNLQHARMEKPDRVSFHTLKLKAHWFVNIDSRRFELVNVEWPKITDLHVRKQLEDLSQRVDSSPYELLSIAYRQLAVNAEENHRYREASWFRCASMSLGLSELSNNYVGKIFQPLFWLYWVFTPKRKHIQPLLWVYWILSGYGERVSKALLVLVLSALIFAGFYRRVGFQSPPQIIGVQSGGSAQVDNIGLPITSFRKAIIYSFEVMALQKPEPKPLTNAARSLVLVETIFGPIQAALLALAIRRRFMR